eukprot:79505_1
MSSLSGFLALLLWPTYCKLLSHNIAYNGPFNVFYNVNQQPRRLATASYPTENVKFYHGVASGDPTEQDLVIWTRATPPFQDEYARDISNQTKANILKSAYQTISIQWAISTSADSIDFDCSDSMCGATDTSVSIDYTVKVIVDSLSSDTWYYYQFKVGDTTSDIGRTRTIPSGDADVDSWTFAFGSCKQYTHGYFNNLGDIADREDLDMMVWIGDYIYEFPDTSLVNGTAIGRTPFPNNYLYNLSHYRGRYLSHHLDGDSQKAHKQLPFYIMWDDHEVVNDYWKDGAPSRWQDDTAYGVDFEHRKANGYQAFFEWTPTRAIDVSGNGGLHRSYRFGNLFDLLLLDARSQRTEPAENTTIGATLSADTHYAYGETQRDWIISQLKDSQSDGTKWRIFGNNNVFGQSPPAEVMNGKEMFGEDKLEGYDAERQIILDAIVENKMNNIITLAGGPHTFILQKIYSTGKPIQDDANSYPIFCEIVLDAICAPKLFEENTLLPYIEEYLSTWSWVSPYIRGGVDGYQVMNVNKKRAKIEYWMNNNTQIPTSTSVLDKVVCVYDDKVEFEDCDKEEKEGTHWSETVAYIFIGFLVLAGVVWLCCIRYRREKRREERENRPPPKPETIPMSPDTNRTTSVEVVEEEEDENDKTNTIAP